MSSRSMTPDPISCGFDGTSFGFNDLVESAWVDDRHVQSLWECPSCGFGTFMVVPFHMWVSWSLEQQSMMRHMLDELDADELSQVWVVQDLVDPGSIPVEA